MSVSTSDCSRAARKLADLFASLPVSNQWGEVELTAQKLANGLRIRDGPVDEHTLLGKTLLPQTLTSLLKAALDGPRVPDALRAPAIYELLRVGANLCVDHDENRAYLLEAGFPQTVLSILEAYAESVPAVPSSEPLPLAVIHLEIIKTAVGVILNCSLGYEPVQSRLISLEAAITILRLCVAIYPPGSWLKSVGPMPQTWNLRRTLSDWSWRAISSLKDNASQQLVFGPESLPFLIAPLRAFVPPYLTLTEPFLSDPPTRHSLMSSDVEALEEVSELLESLSLDVEEVRLAVVRETTFLDDHRGQSCLKSMLDFIEYGDFPPYWSNESLEKVSKWKKSLDLCKAAMIKVVIETAGEDKNTGVLWDASVGESGFVWRMVKWLRVYHEMQPSDARDDLVICSTISLANLVRQEGHSKILVQPPIALVPDLVSLLRPETEIKVKHGVIGLLKHLAQSPSNRSLLGESFVIQNMSSSQVFSQRADIAEVVQLSAIGVLKHMCTNNVENSIALVLPSEGPGPSSLVNQILSLVQRSDSIHIRSEGTRVLVNVIKSLCSSTGDLQNRRRQVAADAIACPESASALAQLLGRSKRYPALLNEAIVALLLVGLQPNGASIVLDALFAQLSPEPSQSHPTSSSNPTSPISAPPTALDMLVVILNNEGNRFQPEIRANLCALLTELGSSRHQKEGEGHAQEAEMIKQATRGGLETIASSSENIALSMAARKTIDAWECQ